VGLSGSHKQHSFITAQINIIMNAATHIPFPRRVISVGLRMSAATTALLESGHRGTFPRLKPILRSRASVSEHALLFCVTSKLG
jgi:hypothetical protein